MNCARNRISAVCLATLLFSPTSHAAWYTFSEISRVQEGQFAALLDASINDHGEVIFSATTASAPDSKSIFRWTKETGTQLAIPYIGSTSSSSSPIIDNSGNIAYVTDEGIAVASKQTGQSKLLAYGEKLELLDYSNGSVLFSNQMAKNQIFTGRSDSEFFKATPLSIKPGFDVVDASLSASGSVALNLRQDIYSGQIAIDGRPSPISSTQHPDIRGYAPYGGTAHGGIDFGDADGSLAFYVDRNGDRDDWNGALHFVDAEGMSLGEVDLGAYDGPIMGLSVANRHRFVFQNWINGNDIQYTGLFTGASPQTDRVIALGDMLGGSMVTGVQLGRHAMNSDGSVVFLASLDGESIGLFVATPCEACSAPPLAISSVPEASTLLMTAIGLSTLALASMRTKKFAMPTAALPPQMS